MSENKTPKIQPTSPKVPQGSGYGPKPWQRDDGSKVPSFVTPTKRPPK
ncbi:hypothetical protein [Clostridium sp.]|jgi:hypothetical protein|nr:hypothetical protein [Clostridium sp.]MDF2505605.1 hypothetical protein [Clostridium sp.]